MAGIEYRDDSRISSSYIPKGKIEFASLERFAALNTEGVLSFVLLVSSFQLLLIRFYQCPTVTGRGNTSG
jgi:hypothetical protein